MDAKKLASLFDSPNFVKWFGNSKAVDPSGAPLTLYHGTPDVRFATEDGVFKGQKERLGFGNESGVHWFTPSERTAKTYADPRRAFDYQNAEPGVIPAYLNVENPIVIDAKGANWRDAQRVGKTSDVIKQAMEEGHDGVIIRNVKDDYNNGKGTKLTDTYAVFDSRKIKSPDNAGTFDPNDPNIYRAALPLAAAGGLMSALAPNDAEARIRAMDAPIEDAWNPLEAFAGGIPGGLKAAAMGVLPDGAMDWALNKFGGLMSGGK
ncbi:MAG: hypothetical protein RBR38_10345 [Desulfomicrobium apsheronum]|nr:hypothetical protein [Desulfomicrobium apsheronum]